MTNEERMLSFNEKDFIGFAYYKGFRFLNNGDFYEEPYLDTTIRYIGILPIYHMMLTGKSLEEAKQDFSKCDDYESKLALAVNGKDVFGSVRDTLDGIRYGLSFGDKNVPDEENWFVDGVYMGIRLRKWAKEWELEIREGDKDYFRQPERI